MTAPPNLSPIHRALRDIEGQIVGIKQRTARGHGRSERNWPEEKRRALDRLRQQAKAYRRMISSPKESNQ